MNQKFKIKIVAVLATLTGSCLSNCHAMQDGSAMDKMPTQGHVQTAVPASGGMFGAVKAALPPNQVHSQRFVPPVITSDHMKVKPKHSMMPPIVSSANRSRSNSMPPIVSSAEATTIPPIVSSTQGSKTRVQTAVAETTQTVKAAAKKPLQMMPAIKSTVDATANATAKTFNNSSMLSPISAAEVKTNEPLVAQATTAPLDSSVDANVSPVAQWQQYQQRTPSGSAGRVSNGGVPILPASSMKARNLNVPIVKGRAADTMVAPSIRPGSQMVSPAPSFDQSYLSAEMPVPNYAGTSTPAYFDAPPMEAPVISSSSNCGCGGAGCSSCGTTSNCAGCGGSGCSTCGDAVSGCNSCGPGGCFDPNSIAEQMGLFGSVPNARRYMHIEGLYINRTDGDIVNSNFGGLGNFNGNAGWRITFGRRSDVTRGNEFSYMGTSSLEDSITRNDAAGRLSALWNVSPFFGGGELSPFTNSVSQTESKETKLHSLEFNRVRWGWDVLKTFIGVRYIHVGDEYQFNSTNNIGEQGEFSMDIENNLIGIHIGEELFYDIGYRTSFSASGKLGLYGNISQADTVLAKDGVRILNANDDNGNVAGSLDFNLTAHYQINQRARLKAGYNAMWLGNVSSVSDNIPTTISPFTGSGVSDTDDMFFHGISIGLEFYR